MLQGCRRRRHACQSVFNMSRWRQRAETACQRRNAQEAVEIKVPRILVNSSPVQLQSKTELLHVRLPQCITVKHGLSYNSMDCSNKLNSAMFSDSNTAKKMQCGRTKAEMIAMNVLAPRTVKDILKAESSSASSRSRCVHLCRFVLHAMG